MYPVARTVMCGLTLQGPGPLGIPSVGRRWHRSLGSLRDLLGAYHWVVESNNDPHLAWIAECRSELVTYDLDDVEASRDEANAALERVLAAGDPRGIAAHYQGLLQELSEHQTSLELEDRLARLDAEGFDYLLRHGDREVRIRTVQRAMEVDLAGGFRVLLNFLVHEPDTHVVATGVRALGVLGGAAAIEAFGTFRTHEDPRVRANAVEGLCDAGAGPDQLLPWADDMDHRVRANVAFGLVDQAPDIAREMFRGLLSASGGTVAEILAQIDVERFFDLYVDALDHVPENRVGDVLRSMVKQPDPRVTRLLLGLLEDRERPFSFRSKVMQAARSMAQACGEEHETSKEVLEEAVQEFLDDVTAQERENAEAERAAVDAERAQRQAERDRAQAQTGDGPGAGSGEDRPQRKSGAQQMQDAAKRWVRLTGRVLDSSNKKPIPRATVRLSSSGRQEVTDRRGRFHMDRLVRGERYIFVVECQGYPSRSVHYRCSGQQDQNLQIMLMGTRAR